MNQKANSEERTQPTNTQPPPPERRSAARFRVETSLDWRRRDDPSSEWKPCVLIDLSIGGAGFTSKEEISVGEELKLRITSPRPEEKGRTVTVSAKVVNSRQTAAGEIRYGVQFSQMFFLFAEWAKGSPLN